MLLKNVGSRIACLRMRVSSFKRVLSTFRRKNGNNLKRYSFEIHYAKIDCSRFCFLKITVVYTLLDLERKAVAWRLALFSQIERINYLFRVNFDITLCRRDYRYRITVIFLILSVVCAQNNNQ